MPVLLPVGHLDAGRARGRAPVTALVAVACVAVFVGPQDAGRSAAWLHEFGATPADLLGGGAGRGVLTLVTSVFAHANWAHLLYNLAPLWVFGAALERAVGGVRFAALFLGAGALGMLAEAALHPASPVPVVGASGAVAALAGAFAVAFPRARVVVAAVFLTVPVRTCVVLGAWVLVEVVAGVGAAAGGPGGVAHGAHLAGFALGVSLMAALDPARRGRWGRGFLRSV